MRVCLTSLLKQSVWPPEEILRTTSAALFPALAEAVATESLCGGYVETSLIKRDGSVGQAAVQTLLQALRAFVAALEDAVGSQWALAASVTSNSSSSKSQSVLLVLETARCMQSGLERSESLVGRGVLLQTLAAAAGLASVTSAMATAKTAREAKRAATLLRTNSPMPAGSRPQTPGDSQQQQQQPSAAMLLSTMAAAVKQASGTLAATVAALTASLSPLQNPTSISNDTSSSSPDSTSSSVLVARFPPVKMMPPETGPTVAVPSCVLVNAATWLAWLVADFCSTTAVASNANASPTAVGGSGSSSVRRIMFHVVGSNDICRKAALGFLPVGIVRLNMGRLHNGVLGKHGELIHMRGVQTAVAVDAILLVSGGPGSDKPQPQQQQKAPLSMPFLRLFGTAGMAPCAVVSRHASNSNSSNNNNILGYAHILTEADQTTVLAARHHTIYIEL